MGPKIRLIINIFLNKKNLLGVLSLAALLTMSKDDSLKRLSISLYNFSHDVIITKYFSDCCVEKNHINHLHNTYRILVSLQDKRNARVKQANGVHILKNVQG